MLRIVKVSRAIGGSTHSRGAVTPSFLLSIKKALKRAECHFTTRSRRAVFRNFSCKREKAANAHSRHHSNGRIHSVPRFYHSIADGNNMARPMTYKPETIDKRRIVAGVIPRARGMKLGFPRWIIEHAGISFPEYFGQKRGGRAQYLYEAAKLADLCAGGTRTEAQTDKSGEGEGTTRPTYGLGPEHSSEFRGRC